MGMFPTAIFLGALLLFAVQPLMGRALLPRLGGAPAVWTTCMLFFQVLLLAGYGYGHLLASRARPRRQALIHALVGLGSLAILGLGALAWGTPLLRPAAVADTDHPQRAILVLLGLGVGAPYFVLATTGPLLQAWRGRLDPARSPYRLYALSNAGSLAGLIGYPLVIEPLAGLRAQAIGWSLLYVALVAAVLMCARRAGRLTDEIPSDDEESKAANSKTEHSTAFDTSDTSPPGRRRFVLWLVLAFVPSLLLLAVSNKLCQDVASVPLLWVLPLALYLVSFILAFDHPRWYFRPVWLPLLVVSSGIACALLHRAAAIRWQIGGWSLVLLAGAMVAHGELARARPSPRHLTRFYLAVALGGALGGIAVGLGAPALLRGYFEIHIAVAAAALVGAWVIRRELANALAQRPPASVRIILGVALGALFAVLGRHAATMFGPGTVSVSRSFFGVLQVVDETRGEPPVTRRTLRHGSIAHGMQVRSATLRRKPTTYYEEASGAGRALRLHPRRESGPLHVGVCGLGTGTVAAYARAGDRYRFYEIDPDVIRLSQGNQPRFTYLADTPARIEIVAGDARVSLERELARGARQDFDVLVVDAFSGDAIPVHLLTREALALYMAHLRPDGVLALHISNRYLDLYPTVRATARSLGLAEQVAATSYDTSAWEALQWESTWVLVARDPAALRTYGEPDVDEEVLARSARARRAKPWTDAYSNLLSTIRF